MPRPNPTLRDYRIPVCSVCQSSEHMRRFNGEWACSKCADEWLGEIVDSRLRAKSKGGVHLPVGVTDERRSTPTFKDAYPNRRARRAAR